MKNQSYPALKRAGFLALISLALVQPLVALEVTGLYPAADSPFRLIADDVEIRSRLKDSWFLAPIREITNKAAVRHYLPDGRYLEVRSEQVQNERLILLTRGQGSNFPIGSQGSWIVHRAEGSGAITRVRFYPRSDPQLFLQFRPANDGRSLMDLVLYGAYPLYSLQLPWKFNSILTEALSRILNLSQLSVLSVYFDINPASYADTRYLLTQIRQWLPELQFADDGALNELGEAVYIATGLPQTGLIGLNCSGFVKWLVDGLLKPITGTYLSLDTLKTPPLPRGNSFSEPFEQALDPYFGLDWIRNLAKAADQVLRSVKVGDDWVVRESPFAALRVSGGDGAQSRPFVGFLPDIGYEIAGLKALLYSLAAQEPGWFYLASVSSDRGNGYSLLRHFHVAALFPYFTETGHFEVACLESAAETSLEAFIARYPGHYVQLVRIPVETRFQP